jgi:uncharacterized protein (TIGR01777 family)
MQFVAGNMRVAITGVNGFLGSALRRALEARGDIVVPFTRDAKARGANEVFWNPNSGELDIDALRAAGPLDAVAHLAGAGVAAHRWTETYKEEILRSRVQGTSLLVDALTQLDGAPRLVSGSAIGFYGTDPEAIRDESAPAGTDFLSRVCVEWERAALAHPDACVLRTGIVLDASGGALAKQLPLFRLGLGGALGNGRQWMSPISLNDHVRATLFCLDQRMSGPVNVVAPEPLRNRDFTNALARAVHRPALFPAPSIALSLVMGSELAQSVILASQRVVPTRLLHEGFRFNEPEIARMLASALHRGS